MTGWGDGWLDAAGADFGLGGMSDIFLFLFPFILGGMLRLKPDPSHMKIYELLEERTLVVKKKNKEKTMFYSDKRFNFNICNKKI